MTTAHTQITAARTGNNLLSAENESDSAAVDAGSMHFPNVDFLHTHSAIIGADKSQRANDK
jgi:hypothetical protein